MIFENIKEKLIGNIGLGNQINRESWLEKTIQSLKPGLKILDAGAGELKYKKLCGHLDYTSQDFGGYNGEGNGEGKQTGTWDNSKLDVVSDIINIPLPGSSFDAIMCIEVFEHIQEPAKAVKEFSRLMKPGGKLIITVPFCSITHFAPYYFANGYSKYWFEKILDEYGFAIDDIVYNGNYFEYMAQEIRRLPEVEKYYSTSKISKSFIAKIMRSVFLIMLNQMSKKIQNQRNYYVLVSMY